MLMTTLTVLLTLFGVATLFASRPPRTSCGDAGSTGYSAAGIVCRTVHQRPDTDSVPPLSLNHWNRRDLSRMLMTDDDYNGRITPRQPDSSQANNQ